MKRLKSTFLHGFVLATLLTTSPGFAIDGEALFRSGVRDFRAGRLEQALHAFQGASQAGYSTGALHYNLGVVHYRLGHYEEARESFDRLTRDPKWQGLAYYNLGLVALKRDDGDTARRWFEKASAVDDPKIRELAARMLEQQAAAAPPAKHWDFSLSAGIGHDDNLVDPADLTATAQSDGFSEVLAAAGRNLSGSYTDGLRLDISAYLARYQEFSIYDLDLLRGELTRSATFGRWATQASAHAEQSRLGGEDYLRVLGVSLQARTPFNGADLRLRYRLNQYTALDVQYAPQEGLQHRLGADARWRGRNSSTWLAYLFETNDREDLLETTTFTSFSPTRHTLKAGTSRSVGRGEVGIELAARQSEYADPNHLSDGTSITRQDDRWQALLFASYPLGSVWRLRGDYVYADNDSNIVDYDYQQNLFTVSLSAAF